MFGECVVDFVVSRNRLFLPRQRIQKNIVPATMSHENTAVFKKIAYQFGSL